MAIKLSILPTELVEHVAGNLEREDLLRLRLVCQSINDKTLRLFGQAWFSTQKTDLSYHSLQKLKRVAEHVRFRHCVQELVIKGPIWRILEGEIGTDLPWTRFSSGHLIPSPPTVETLRAILLQFGNCRSFQVLEYSKLEGALEMPYDGRLTPSEAIIMILTLITESGLPAKSLLIRNDERKNSIDPKQPDVIQYQEQGLRDGWAHLQELILEHHIIHERLEWLTELIVSASNLQILELCPFPDQEFSKFFERLASASNLPRIQKLRLWELEVTEECLSGLILRLHDSLHAFSFRYITIINGGTWASVFEKLEGKLPRLKQISVEMIGERKRYVTFPSLEDNPVLPNTNGQKFDLTYRELHGYRFGRWVSGANYLGSHANDALHILARSVVYYYREWYM